MNQKKIIAIGITVIMTVALVVGVAFLSQRNNNSGKEENGTTKAADTEAVTNTKAEQEAGVEGSQEAGVDGTSDMDDSEKGTSLNSEKDNENELEIIVPETTSVALGETSEQTSSQEVESTEVVSENTTSKVSSPEEITTEKEAQGEENETEVTSETNGTIELPFVPVQ